MSSSSFNQPTIAEISVGELARLLAEAPDSWQLVDVREPFELELAQLDGFENFPLSQSYEWSEHIHTRLDANKPTVVLCHHGMRSAQMCQWLLSQGFTNVKNITGGIDAYSVIVDPSVPRY